MSWWPLRACHTGSYLAAMDAAGWIDDPPLVDQTVGE